LAPYPNVTRAEAAELAIRALRLTAGGLYPQIDRTEERAI